MQITLSAKSVSLIIGIAAPVCAALGGAGAFAWKALDARYVHASTWRDHLYADSVRGALDDSVHAAAARRAAIRDFVLDSIRTHGHPGRVLQAGNAR